MNTNDLLLIAARQRPSLTGDKIGNTNWTISLYYHLFNCLCLLTAFCSSSHTHTDTHRHTHTHKHRTHDTLL